LPTEAIPDFISTIYTYHGLDHEEAPKDVTEVNIHPSVTIIKASAFEGCRSLVRVTIPDTVTRIELMAFAYCASLRFIRLSTNLEYIGFMAFHDCTLIEALFLPTTVTCIGIGAFNDCISLRFCNLPDSIYRIGAGSTVLLLGCDRLVSTRLGNNLFMHKLCYSTSVSPQTVQVCIARHGIEHATEVDDQQMAALHILCANPHVTGDCIRTYLQLAPEAAEQQDSDGMTPFQRLCRNGGITFLEDRSFSSLMIWWYHCMPPQTETSKKRKRG